MDARFHVALRVRTADGAGSRKPPSFQPLRENLGVCNGRQGPAPKKNAGGSSNSTRRKSRCSRQIPGAAYPEHAIGPARQYQPHGDQALTTHLEMNRDSQEPFWQGRRQIQMIRVELSNGRTKAQKRAFVEDVTKAMGRHCNCAAEFVQVVFFDVDNSDWAVAGKFLSDPK